MVQARAQRNKVFFIPLTRQLPSVINI
jgi:hypothetical protein